MIWPDGGSLGGEGELEIGPGQPFVAFGNRPLGPLDAGRPPVMTTATSSAPTARVTAVCRLMRLVDQGEFVRQRAGIDVVAHESEQGRRGRGCGIGSNTSSTGAWR